MGEILESRCLQMLADLAVEDKDACGMKENHVKQFVLLLTEIEDLLKKKGDIGRKSLNHISYMIEDVLESWAVTVEVANMRSKKRVLRSLLARFVCGRDDGITSFMFDSIIMEVEFMIEGFHDMHPDDDMESVDELQAPADRRSVPWPRQSTYANGMVEHFVGMDEDLKQLVSLLVDEVQDQQPPHRPVVSVCGVEGLVDEVQDQQPSHRPVISVCGVEGMGKTTLARNVYNHCEVRTHFKAFALLSLGQDCEFGNLLQDLLKQLGAAKKNAEEQKKGAEEKKKNAENQKKKNAEEQKKGVGVSDEEKKKKGVEEKKKTSEEIMIGQLKETQRKKKCFIVIDGVSEMRQWEQIRSAFLLAEGTNTRILLTTTDEEIAGVGLPYKLNLLHEEKGWELLQKYIFRGGKAPDLGLVPKLGKEFVHKCGYLPSAISSLGRILSKIPQSEWYKVIDDVNGYLKRDNQSQSNDRQEEVLGPRYDLLPLRDFHLKQCLLYLGIFKENMDVDSDDLTLLWIAEGMVSPQRENESMTMEERAEDYLRKLADKNMLKVQVDELSASRRFMRLCLHNHVRELALYQGEKVDFRLKVIDFSEGEQPIFHPHALSDGTRRLVIHFKKLVDSSSLRKKLNETGDLRSLFFLNSDREYVDLPVRISDFGEFILLRVVHFVRCKFEGRKLPEGIVKLVNLRYFGILYCHLEKLPASISNFRNLYVLNVRANDDAKITIPNVISNMVRLKHVSLPNNLDHEQQQSEKLKLGGLHDLETLVGFNAEIHDLASLTELSKLRLLVTHAYSNDSLESLVRFFRDNGEAVSKQLQTNLFIEYKCDLTSPEGTAILEEVLMSPKLFALTFSMVLLHKFPNCGMHASKTLTQIKLIGCKLGEDPMEALGKFPELRKLCLGYGAFVGKEMAIDTTGFPSLEYLELRCLPNLEEWRVDVGALGHLSTLTVRRCPKLKTIPKGLASVSSLENMEIELAITGALFVAQKAEYHRMFASVNSCIIREINLDHLSACG